MSQWGVDDILIKISTKDYVDSNPFSATSILSDFGQIT